MAEQTTRRGYKIVKVVPTLGDAYCSTVDFRLYSWQYNSLPREVAVEYKPGVAAVPKLEGSALYAFRYLRDTLHIARSSSLNVEVWEVDLVPTRRQRRRRLWNNTTLETITAFWASVPKYKLSYVTDNPAGTIHCSEITLRRLIWSTEKGLVMK